MAILLKTVELIRKLAVGSDIVDFRFVEWMHRCGDNVAKCWEWIRYEGLEDFISDAFVIYNNQ